MKSALFRWGALALVVGSLAGCGGGGGGGGSAAPAAGAGAGAAPGAPAAVAVPPAGAVAAPAAGAAGAAAFAAIAPAVVVGGVAINSPPQVTFAVTDTANGSKGVYGMFSTSKSATATVASYPNIAFSLAKLVPGTGGAPSKWVSYIVTTVPTTTTASVPTRPTTDNTGTLVDNLNGTYTYTFYRDITKVKAEVAAAAETATNINADLGDLTYEPNLVHRLTIQISGNAPGTGTNTSNGVQVITGVPMTKPLDVIYDFIPATGKAVTAADPSRDIVATAKCNECHYALGGIPGSTATSSPASFHGGSRNETRYCVVCHTDQRKYGRSEATTTATGYTGGTYKVNGLTVGNLPHYIHKTHMGAVLAKDGYDYAGVKFETVHYPQDIRNCTKCHDGSATSSAKTAQGDNWKNVPSRIACGACHDGISFVTGKGLTLKDKAAGLTTSTYGHVGGSQSDDSACAICHKPADINTYHIPVTPPNKASALHVAGGNTNTNAAWIASNTDRLPAGAIKVSYEISSVSRNASKNPVMSFRLLQNGVATPLNTFGPGVTEIWNNFIGSPSVYFVYGMPQDGITAPADFNASASVYLRSLWNGVAAATGTLSAPDASGFYTATLTGVTIPDTAVMLTGGVGYSYNVKSTLPLTQTNLASYPVTASPVPVGAGATDITAGMPNMTGGLIVITPNAQKVATGYTGRRTIVSDALCNKCHQELGTFTEEAFHGGQRNDGTTCSWCHTPNRTSSGWSADSTAFVHAIHASSKRTVKYNWHAISTTSGFYNIHYPGVLKNCEACHVAGGYDFSNNPIPSPNNRQYRTVATGTTAAATYTTSPYIAQTAGTVYGSGYSVSSSTGVITAAAGTTLVSSPTVAVCTGCHDSTTATQHMESNGGSFYKDRTTSLAKSEQCMFCHQTTSAFGLGIKTVHTIK